MSRGGWMAAWLNLPAAARCYPYGVGTNEVHEWGVGRRWLLLAEDGNLRAAPPRWYRDACKRLNVANRDDGAGT